MAHSSSESATRRAGSLEEVEVVARQWGAPRALAKALRVQDGRGRQGGLPPLLREAVDLLEGSRATLERARCLLELGSTLRRTNQRAEARELLRQAVELAHAGESPHCGAGAGRADGQRRRPRRIALSGLESLTPSERRVAAMAAKEMTNRDIAQALFVTPKTVEVHLSSVYRKLGHRLAPSWPTSSEPEESGLEAPAAPALG